MKNHLIALTVFIVDVVDNYIKHFGSIKAYFILV